MKRTTTRAIDVAKYFVLLAEVDEEDYLTPLRLQKLLYYAQGWSLAMLDHPLFREEIEAWSYGPVVREVFDEFKHIGREGIPPSYGDEQLDSDARNLVRQVWETYKAHSAISLANMTHNEAPWKDARRGLSREEYSNNVITTRALKKYFKELSQKG